MEQIESWAAIEFGNAELGNRRRRDRLIQLASAVGRRPSASLPETVGGDEAALKGMYRFFDNDQVDPDRILASHVVATVDRLAEVDLVLAVQDTTSLDFTDHGHTTGLGRIGPSERRQGLMVHSTLLITPERVPLGVLQQQVWARSEQAPVEDHHHRSIDEKESRKWLTSLEAVIAMQAMQSETHFISVGDAEADVYDLLLMPRPAGVDLLIRAAQDRRVEHTEARLWARLAAAPVSATVTVQVGRRDNQPAREAELSVRWRRVVLRPPRSRAKEHLPTVTVWAVWVIEEHPPAEVEPIEWMLVTTVPLHSVADALRCLEWYACRWGIEVWHKVLKSGCRIEARQLQTAERLQRCLAVFSVVSWYVLYATMLARVLPDIACTALLDDDQWQALFCITHSTSVLPNAPPKLGDAVRWIAALGGHIGRKRDGPPGVTVLWRGFQRLFDMTLMFRALRPLPSLAVAC